MSVLQLHEGVVVGGKTCVDALLGERVATCVEMGCLLSGSSSKCLALRSEYFLAVQTEVNQFLDPTPLVGQRPCRLLLPGRGAARLGRLGGEAVPAVSAASCSPAACRERACRCLW